MGCDQHCGSCQGCPDIYQPEYLTATCGRENEIEFFRHHVSGFPCVRLTSAFGIAEISLYGAHVLSWKPMGQEPVIFLSDKAVFTPGKAIRGGIPVCWPWFGACKENPSNPSHGFARIMFWNVHKVACYADGRREVAFILKSSARTRRYWAHDFEAILTVTIGWELAINLTVKNTGKDLFTYTEALHSYFQVGDAEQIKLMGLENSPFLDAKDQFREKREEAPLTISSPIDRVYCEHIGRVTIEDPALQRRLLIDKNGSTTTVVWNPGKEGSKGMKDFGDEEYKKMVCVEAANAWNNTICLLPGESHSTGQTIIVE